MRFLPLARGRGVALVDDEDYVWLARYQAYADYNSWLLGRQAVAA